MSTPGILVLGNVNVDLVLGPVDGWPAIGTEVMVERSEMRAGGSAGNTALALSGLGVPHRLIASAGSDPNGDWLRGAFEPKHCDWISDPGATTLTVGIVHKGGDRVFFTTPGHLQTALIADLVARLPAAPGPRACAIISGGFLMPEICIGTADLLDVLKAKGWLTAIDPGWPPAGWSNETRSLLLSWLARVDFALLNDEEVRGFSGLADIDAAIEAISCSGTLVVKRGPEGAVAIHGKQRVAASAPTVTVVDTVGAGDTFNAAFLAAIANGEGLRTALEAGTATAARAISTWPRSYR